jgi:hypothetical protein
MLAVTLASQARTWVAPPLVNIEMGAIAPDIGLSARFFLCSFWKWRILGSQCRHNTDVLARPVRVHAASHGRPATRNLRDRLLQVRFDLFEPKRAS